MADPNKLSIDDIEGLPLSLMTKAPYEHKHRFDDIEDHEHLLNTLYSTLAANQHTHTAADIEGYSKVIDAVGRLETRVSELANRPSQIVQQTPAPQIVQQIITPQPYEAKSTGKIGYRDIVDLTELFDIIKKRSQPRLTVLAKEPEEDRVLHIHTTIVNPMGYCLCKAKLELIDLSINSIISTISYADLKEETFILSVLVPENERFRGLVRLTDPMNKDLSIIEHIRIQG